eukprot:3634015-Rhodomonas_salina.2
MGYGGTVLKQFCEVRLWAQNGTDLGWCMGWGVLWAENGTGSEYGVRLWAEKEYRNLHRLYLAKLPCPRYLPTPFYAMSGTAYVLLMPCLIVLRTHSLRNIR